MTNITDALINLYIALGGDVDDVENITNVADMINAIAAAYVTGEIAQLPVVTSADNGKVLTVVAGKWDKANLPE